MFWDKIAFYQSKLASLYDRLNYYDKMVEYCEKSLSTRIQMKDEAGIATPMLHLPKPIIITTRMKRPLNTAYKVYSILRKKRTKRKVFNAYVETLDDLCQFKGF
jgi:hypothetical protein